MAGNASRNKGYRGEREIIALLQPVVSKVCAQLGCVELILKRNLHQRFEKKQYDIDGLPWLALEVKRCEPARGRGEHLNGQVNAWWKQVKEATRPGQTSVLIYRKNNEPWIVRTRVPVKVAEAQHVIATVTMPIHQWLVWFELKIRAMIERT